MGLDIFYSQLHRVLSNAPDKIFGNSKQVKLWLQSNAAKYGIKQDEILWSGVTDWLDLQVGTVTKADILNYLDGNGVRITETMLGGSAEDLPMSYEELPKSIQKLFDAYDRADIDAEQLRERSKENGYDVQFGMDGELESVVRLGTTAEPSKYAKYVVPGGSHYKELLLTLPTKPNPDSGTLEHLSEVVGERIFRDSGHLFKSKHWDQTNILAHIRFDERTDAEGNKVLFVQEIQSDWGQQGKKQGFGYKDATPLTPEEDRELMDLFDMRGNRKPEQTARMHALNNRLNASQGKSGIPVAPFVTDTKSWVALALKRMVLFAAENGFDKVAIISGQQAADLYDLRKQIKEITLDRLDRSADKKYGIAIELLKGGWQRMQVDTVEEATDIIGKESAQKLFEQIEGKNQSSLSGEDLRVGGEGMQVFYDKIVPNVANDILRRNGGGKIEELRLPQELDTKQYYDPLGFNKSDVKIERDGANWWSAVSKDGQYWDGGQWVADEGLTRLFTSRQEVETSLSTHAQLGFVITPELRAMVLDHGLPLFSKGDVQFEYGMPVEVIEAEINRMRQQWLSMPRVTVVNGVSELPFDAPANADGAYSNGHVYVVAGNIQDLKQLQKVMAHECVLHHSLQEMLGDYGFSKLHSGIQALKKAGDPIVTALAQNILERYGELPPESETKEIIARAGEQCLDETGNVRIGYGFMKGVYAGVASWLRDQGFKIPFTNLELQGIMHNAGEWIQLDHERGNHGVNPLRGLVSPVLHSFAGVRAEGAPLGALARAREASSVGAGGDVKAIHQETGWFSGTDGKWRFEISDADARLTMDGLTSADHIDLANGDTAGIELGQLMDHPALFSAYPELKTVWVVIDPNKDGASFRHGDRTLRIGYDKEARTVNLSSLLHETQHAIQAYEGFSRGGSPDEFMERDITDKELNRINQEVHKLYAQNPDFYRDSVRATQLQIAVKDKYGSSDGDIEDPLMKDWWAAIDKRDAHPEATQWFSLKSMEYQVGKQRIIDSQEDQYHRLSGEVEARLTQTRMKMSQEERLAVFPLDAMDVPASGQTVRFADRKRPEVVAEGSFSGRVLEVSGGVVLQKVGRTADEVARHDPNRLSTSVALGDVVDIKYRDGVGVVCVKGLAVGVDR